MFGIKWTAGCTGLLNGADDATSDGRSRSERPMANGTDLVRSLP
jgi:hypothetical protein